MREHFVSRRPAGGACLVWDAQDGLLYTVPLTRRTNGWTHLAFTFPTRAHAGDIQVRLYAPKGRVLWDDVQLRARGHAGPSSRAAGGGVQVSSLAARRRRRPWLSRRRAGGRGDIAGEASNAYKAAEARALWGYIKKRPIYGLRLWKVASRFATGYSYELSYLDLALKAGIIGLLLYLSFPLRLMRRRVAASANAALRASRPCTRIGAPGVVVGVVAGILLAGATNPYLFAAFGLVSILMMVAWLEEAQPARGERARTSPGPS